MAFHHRRVQAEKPISFVTYRGQVTDSGYSGIFAFEGDWESDLKDKSSQAADSNQSTN